MLSNTSLQGRAYFTSAFLSRTRWKSVLLLLLSVSAQAANEQADTPLAYYRLDPLANKRILPHSSPKTLGEPGGKLTLAGCRDEY